ncbi:unknown protein [Leptolyngbya sp. NIES-3755]|nr:unknown protein [Leptolyngbya sp. NIES-3755]
MNAYKVETVVLEDGKVLLQGLPFRVGETVEVIVLEGSTVQERSQPLETTEIHGTFDPADRVYLESVSSLMSEWESEADEQAYADL